MAPLASLRAPMTRRENSDDLVAESQLRTTLTIPRSEPVSPDFRPDSEPTLFPLISNN